MFLSSPTTAVIVILPLFIEPIARVTLLLSALAAHRPPCPAGSASDDARATAVRDVLATTPDGTRLARAGARPMLCFTAGDGGIADGPSALVPRDAELAQQAARFAHLWRHVVDDAPRVSPADDQSCAAFGGETARAEAQADATEARVAAALLTTPLPHRDRNTRSASRCSE